MNRKFASAWPASLFTALILLMAASAGLSQNNQPWSQNVSPLPPPTGFVNDYAGVIDEGTKQQLEAKIKDFKEKTNPPVELAVAVVRTTGERPIFDYSLAVARGWKIGSKETDNPSALLFVAIDDRKYFTQVSKDLEDELPDGVVGSLQRQYLVPEFRKGNYSKGIADTVDAYISTIESRRSGVAAAPTPEQPGRTAGVSQSLYSLFCCLVIVGVLALIIFSNLRKSGKTPKDRDRWGGGGFGGGGSALPWVIGSILTSGGGSSSSSSSSSDWGGSSGSDWGGFGGGGDFGGGGAGGDW